MPTMPLKACDRLVVKAEKIENKSHVATVSFSYAKIYDGHSYRARPQIEAES
jgi:hypothetical protein